MNTDVALLALLASTLGGAAFLDFYKDLPAGLRALFLASVLSIAVIGGSLAWEYLSKPGKERRRRISQILEIPKRLITPSLASVYLGLDQDLSVPVYLPDFVRSRHVHILGATGSGKTESVILNFLRQDLSRDLGSIILDAKGDASFLAELTRWVPSARLRVFDLSSAESLPYNPLLAGGPLEAAQRLFASLVWSEEYYRSKAFTALQRLFEVHRQRFEKNPTLTELNHYLEAEENFTSILESDLYPAKLASKDFLELSGLRDQIRGLTIGYLKTTLSPADGNQVEIEEAERGSVIYFRLQSLLSPQLVATVGKLIINHLSFVAGTAHRKPSNRSRFIPTYLDEFASFACPEFADLISKARSAGLALHFSHQSIGDLTEVSPGFVSRITDNSGTKIVLRVNDPDTADLMARTFGTRLYQKVTQRITNTEDIQSAEIVGEGSQREAHQFRAAPDLFKTHPTGVASVLIAHGEETPHGASTVFRVKFPRLEGSA